MDDPLGPPTPCPRCRAPIPAVERICPSCGHDMRQAARPRYVSIVGGCMSAVVGAFGGLLVALELARFARVTSGAGGFLWFGGTGVVLFMSAGALVGWAVGYYTTEHWR